MATLQGLINMSVQLNCKRVRKPHKSHCSVERCPSPSITAMGVRCLSRLSLLRGALFILDYHCSGERCPSPIITALGVRNLSLLSLPRWAQSTLDYDCFGRRCPTLYSHCSWRHCLSLAITAPVCAAPRCLSLL